MRPSKAPTIFHVPFCYRHVTHDVQVSRIPPPVSGGLWPRLRDLLLKRLTTLFSNQISLLLRKVSIVHGLHVMIARPSPALPPTLAFYPSPPHQRERVLCTLVSRAPRHLANGIWLSSNHWSKGSSRWENEYPILLASIPI